MAQYFHVEKRNVPGLFSSGNSARNAFTPTINALNNPLLANISVLFEENISICFQRQADIYPCDLALLV